MNFSNQQLDVPITHVGNLNYEPLEIFLNRPDDFLKIRETLTRIGEADMEAGIVFQFCHILHRKGRYYIMSYKELYALDEAVNEYITDADIQFRNRVAKLVEEWGMARIRDREKFQTLAPMHRVKVVPYREKAGWVLSPIYKKSFKES